MNIVGARPNFMKIAPIQRQMNADSAITPFLVHTGQHYDERMSKFFFDDLQLPQPDVYLGVGSGSHATQTAKVMVEFETLCQNEKPDWVVVVGDVNSTLACSLVAAKQGIPVAHVEAGLRSFDRAMPEEINRIVTDALSDLLFTSEESGNRHLAHEGIAEEKVHFVGNVMIDSLLHFGELASRSPILEQLEVGPKSYALVTLHRPSNVDDRDNLCQILKAFEEIQQELPIIFPIHPRTRKTLDKFELGKLISGMPNLRLIPPAGYLDFMQLTRNARFVMTDSGGIQEETTVLGIPCMTLRENTERPVTVTLGTNEIVGNQKHSIINAARRILNGQWKNGTTPPLWDGQTAARIVEVFKDV